MPKPNARLYIKGSPSVASIAAASDALRTIGGHVIEARCRCDGCGAKSEPVDLSHPEAAEVALREAGWSRDSITHTDLCPTCANAGA